MVQDTRAEEIEIEFARKRFELGVPKTQIAKECGRVRSTIYTWEKKYNWERKNQEDPTIEFLPFSTFLEESKGKEQTDIQIDFDLGIIEKLKMDMNKTLNQKLREIEDSFNAKLEEMETKNEEKLKEQKEQVKQLKNVINQVAATMEATIPSSNVTCEQEENLQEFEQTIQNLNKELELANWRIDSILKGFVGE